MKFTPETLKALLIEHDNGVLMSGWHAEGREFCAMEFLAKIAGEPWTDKPKCVHPALSAYCRQINDAPWSSDEERTDTMLPLLAAVFGTRDLQISMPNISEHTIRIIVPIALEAAADIHPDETHKAALMAAADMCRKECINASAAIYADRVASAAGAAGDGASDVIKEASYSASYSAGYAARSAMASRATGADSAIRADRAARAASYAARAARVASYASSDAAQIGVYKASISIVISEIQRARTEAQQ